MTRFIALLFVSAAIAGMAGSALADGTAKQFLQLDASDDGVALAETKIVAQGEGISIANAALPANAKLYCQPTALVLTGPQLADMVRRAVKADDKLEDQMVSSVLLGVLKNTFPCAAAAH